MKNILAIVLFASLFFISCGPSMEDIKIREKDKDDSIKKADSTRVDSVISGTAMPKLVNLIGKYMASPEHNIYVYTVDQDTFVVATTTTGVSIVKK